MESQATTSGSQQNSTWLSRLPAVSAGVSQLSNGFATLTTRTAQVASYTDNVAFFFSRSNSASSTWADVLPQAKDAAVEEGQTWQRRIASLSGHLTGALSNAFATSETATAQALLTSFSP